MQAERSRLPRTALLALSIIIVGYLTYRDMLGYFFTAQDSPTLIDTARIRSFQDVLRIFNEPLMNGTTLTELSLFYRPIATLSYSLDYSLLARNPFGYHLTYLILHVLVSLLVFVLLLRLAGKPLAAWLGAIIFTTHPILVESVPAVARRHDVIAALFVLASLLFYMKHRASPRRASVYGLASILTYLLALGAKEIAIILPALIVSYLVIFAPHQQSLVARAGAALKSALPFLVVTALFLGFRAHVVQGVGGYDPSLIPLTDKLNFFAGTLKDYVAGLVYPASFTRTFFHPFPTVLQKTASQIALLFLFVLLYLSRPALSKLIGYYRQPVLRAIMVGLTGLALVSLIGVLAYPSLAPFVNGMIERAYQGQGPAFLSAAMTKSHEVPVEQYLYRGGELLSSMLSKLFLVSVLSVSALIAIARRPKLTRFFMETDSGLTLIFFGIWVLIPLAIYLVTFTFNHRYLYISVIPFSGGLAILLSESVRALRSAVRRAKSRASSLADALAEPSALAFLLLLGVTLSLLVYSPLVRTYGEWKDSGEISSKILNRVSEVAPGLPNDAVIEVFALPERIVSYETVIPHVRTPSYLADYSIKSWLDLHHPANRITVLVGSRSQLEAYPHHVDLGFKHGASQRVEITIMYDVTSRNSP